MGVAQVNLAEAYLASINQQKGFQQLSFSQFPHAGLVSTFANDRFITCSAAAGTAFATGYKTNIGNISTDSSGVVPYKSIAEYCKENGMKVGILSSVSIDHATPAVFYAHQPSRNNYYEIGLELANSDFDFFGGGGLKEPTSRDNGKERHTIELAKENGFTYIETYEELMKIGPGNERVIAVHPALLESAAMPYVIDEPQKPSLADFTQKAIEFLDNEAGFFMMVEGGKIDWACHKNDAASSVHETIAFDDAIRVALDFYFKHPEETLIVVTADHETGGLALGANKTKYESNFQYLQHQKVSFDQFNKLLADFINNRSGKNKRDREAFQKLVAANFGLGSEIPLDESEQKAIWQAFKTTLKGTGSGNKLYGDFPPVTELLINMMSEKAGIGWTTYSHTGINIPIYAIGPGSEMFTGVIDNTDIPGLLMMKIGIPEYDLVD
jgi:alkaline phosphatase